MDKKESIVNFLMKQPYRDVINIHNAWCDHNHNDKRIYFIDKLWIESQFPTAVDLYNAIKYKGFDPTKHYCKIDCNGKYHHSSILDMIDLDAIAEHIVRWGDAGYQLKGDINKPLMEGFIDTYKEMLSDRYSELKVRLIVYECDADFLMDDWDDILKDVFNVAGVCPECGEVIYQDNIIEEYNYDFNTLTFKCSRCEMGCTGTLTI